MLVTKYELWDNIPGTTNTKPYILHCEPQRKLFDNCLVIFPGSGYSASPSRPIQEGMDIAEYFCRFGITVFIVEYRVKPDYYPLPILDGRRAMRFVRYNSEKFGIDKRKIALMGFSAGGHLASTMSGYLKPLEYEGMDDIDKESFTPDYQILCYPVINMDLESGYAHAGSANSLLNEKYEELKDELSMDKIKLDNIPPTFIFHNFDDGAVNVSNSFRYAENIKKSGASVEMHIFPDGGHGVGICKLSQKDHNHDRAWLGLLCSWLKYNGFQL